MNNLQNKKRTVDLLNGPILSAITKLALPIMATSLLQMAYNMIDIIWIGRIGSDAVTAVGAAGMYLWLSSGFAMFAKVGGQVKVGHSLGSGNHKEAADFARAAIVMGILIGIIYGFICLIAAKPLIGFFKLNSQMVITDAENYLRITGGGVVFSFVNMIITGILMAMGNSTTPLRVTCVGVLLNMVLDPLFIFGYGPIPEMGVIGAALATLLAQIIAMVLIVIAVLREKMIFGQIDWKKKFSIEPVKVMLKISFPAGIQSIFFTGISMVIARLIAGWGDTAIAVQKVGSQIESISWMTAEGFSAALGAFVAQNYGANNLKRMKKGYFTAMVIVGIWGVFSTLLLLLFPGQIFGIFIPDKNIIPAGIEYLTILGISQFFMCIEIATAGAFSGIGKTIPPSVEGVILTTLRIPLAMVLGGTALGIAGIWWSISISTILKGIVLFIWFMVVLHKVMQQKSKD